MSNRLITNLSKGFKQRVGIAQAILHQPEIVVLEEPTVGLDPIQIRQIRELIRELGKDHSVVLSSHILPEVQAVCDRVQIINQGVTVFSDTFAQLENRQQASFVSVGFDEGGDKQSLEKLTGVKSVEVLNTDNSKTKFLLRYSQSSPSSPSSPSSSGKPSDPDTSEIYQLAVAKNWKLNELSKHKETLEQIFMDLIHGETAQEKVDEPNKAANG
jgi:ABC-2 type transport system ATP-binding protein